MRAFSGARLAAPLLLAALGVAGCGGHRAVSTRAPIDLAWPTDDPRVRLLRIIDLRDARTGGAARVLRWLGGETAQPLFQRPYAVAWDGDDLLLTDPDLGRVARIAPGGRIALSPEGQLRHPIGIAVCPQGILVTDVTEGRLALLDHDLERVRWLADDLKRPTGVVCDSRGAFMAETAAHRIRVLDPGGAARALGRRGAAPGEFNFPATLALDGDRLLVGDTLNFRIQSIDPDSGKSLRQFGQLGDAPGETPRIKGVAVDAMGHIWATDAILDRVSLFNGDGAFLMSLGGTGSDPGQFSFPAGVAAHPDGRVVVSDSLNRRLQIFQLVRSDDAPAR